MMMYTFTYVGVWMYNFAFMFVFACVFFKITEENRRTVLVTWTEH